MHHVAPIGSFAVPPEQDRFEEPMNCHCAIATLSFPRHDEAPPPPAKLALSESPAIWRKTGASVPCILDVRVMLTSDHARSLSGYKSTTLMTRTANNLRQERRPRVEHAFFAHRGPTHRDVIKVYTCI